MSDEDALLSAIIAHPDEDTPRLMYADWLQENGQPERGEFIRLECRMARATELDWADDARWGELCLVADRENWLGGMPQFEGAQWEFCRGMPEQLTVQADTLFANYEQIAQNDWIRSLCLDRVMNWDVEEFTRRPWNPRWVRLYVGEHPMSGIYVHDYDNTRSLAAIANCPQAQQLRHLQFSMFGLTGTGLRALAASPYLDRLEKLSLSGDPNSPDFEPLLKRFGARLVHALY